jgi:biopolymer transport protein TolR
MAIGGMGGSRNSKKRHALMNEINVTPLVDVMLVLLIIFMVTSPMLVSGINVDLPKTESTPVSGQDEPLTISIDKKGNTYIMETKIQKNDLTEKLKAITKEKLDTRIFVRGDKGVLYGDIMDVVSSINAAGFSKVALITQIKYDDK